MDGGANNDTYNFADNFGADRISADSAGVDTLDFAALTSTFTGGNGVSIDLRAQGSLCPSTKNGCISLADPFIENVVGTTVGDLLVGNLSGNKINGGGGDDRIQSGNGNDEIIPGEGHDVVFAGAGDDLIYARDTDGVDYIGCGGGFDMVETIHRYDRTLSNCERSLGPRQGDI
jgi:Ca2+-binding RTX toxin-like protein